MKYSIHILSDWHIGSGLGSGAESDANVLKDSDNLPYIPGKAIKGLFKASLLELPLSIVDINDVNRIFGYEVIDSTSKKVLETKSGLAFFSNAKLSEEERKETMVLSDFLYRNISSTSIDENGVALNHSLRTMEVCMPLTLVGEISGISDEDKPILKNAAKLIRGIGVNRNRGLGRCKIVIHE
jgi:CRISPR/Cas system CSM-associated protein Csm3 (group 7 of RAMP superfamily)